MFWQIFAWTATIIWLFGMMLFVYAVWCAWCENEEMEEVNVELVSQPLVVQVDIDDETPRINEFLAFEEFTDNDFKQELFVADLGGEHG